MEREASALIVLYDTLADDMYVCLNLVIFFSVFFFFFYEQNLSDYKNIFPSSVVPPQMSFTTENSSNKLLFFINCSFNKTKLKCRSVFEGGVPTSLQMVFVE